MNAKTGKDLQCAETFLDKIGLINIVKENLDLAKKKKT